MRALAQITWTKVHLKRLALQPSAEEADGNSFSTIPVKFPDGIVCCDDVLRRDLHQNVVDRGENETSIL